MYHLGRSVRACEFICLMLMLPSVMFVLYGHRCFVLYCIVLVLWWPDQPPKLFCVLSAFGGTFCRWWECKAELLNVPPHAPMCFGLGPISESFFL